MAQPGLIECRGTKYPYEDVVCYAWTDIPAVYFPQWTPPNSTIHYAIQREAYRALPPAVSLHHKRPDIIVIRLQNLPPPQPGQGQRAEERDVLWIECKAPNHDTPGEWKDAINEAVGRLAYAHPDRMVFLIIAIGLKWMPFVWNPELNIALATAQQQGQAQLAANLQAQIDQVSPLRVVMSNRQEAWDLDPRLHMIDPTTLLHQRHVRENPQGELFVNTTEAYTLDYWTLD
ncbi:hypothetical protein QBC46DRAFT_413892 [Diplogelasinospora grovesii]|uniref:Uncharacterized protein n=1 Tax=Diplogelasinospora grovesii TaxID=303347 RepID=A0AAN6RZ42_9PEZI|nr:hypothetical protein QBC46DRAFT_413892 [Diplogelasinospora grovesii]